MLFAFVGKGMMGARSGVLLRRGRALSTTSTSGVQTSRTEIPNAAKIPPKQSRGQIMKNAGVAALLVAFVGGVYYTAIKKMRPDSDELTHIIEEEGLKRK